MNELRTCAIFFLGAGIGAAIAWKATSKHYENIIDEEIESVKQCYRNENSTLTEIEKDYIQKDEEEIVTLVRDYSGGMTSTIVDESPSEDNDIYRITDNEFIEGKPHYDKITITHFIDGYYVDDEGVLMEGDEAVGAHTFDDIPDGFDGVEYVRNDYTSTDYEVIFSTERYSESLREE